MIEFFRKLLDTSDFPARWYCGIWSDFLGWLHIVSDVAIGTAYIGIPLSLVYFARQRKDIVLPRIMYLFAAFIICCGLTHLIEAVIFWHPIYRISGLAKLLTAIVSWATFGVLIKNMPAMLKLPSIATTNQALADEMAQRTRIERELRAANARHDALLDGTRSIVWTTDHQGKFVTPQPSWSRYTGQSWDALQDFGWIDVIHEADRPELMRRWKYALSSLTKYQFTGRIWSDDHKAWHRFVAEAVPVTADDGSVIEWVGTISDIEDQYQAEMNLGIAETELARQKRELELIYQSAPVGMSLIDREYRYIRINETLARINGFPRENHIGRRSDEMLVDLNDQIRPIYEQVFETGKPITNIEVIGKTPASDETRTWLVSYYPLQVDEDASGSTSGEVTAVSAIVQDITDRKRQEQLLVDSEQVALAASRSKSEFLANMSHEIRTPMAAILGYADVLLGHLKDPDNRNCVLIMKRNGDYLLELINDILDLSRIEAGKLDVEWEDTDLSALVGGIESLMQVRAAEQKNELKVIFTTDVPRTVRTDGTRLRQVLINLLGNALKFTEAGRVELSIGIRDVDSRSTGQSITNVVDEVTSPVAGDSLPRPLPNTTGILRPMLVFTVTDTGIGMSNDQVAKLFQPFSQGDASVTRNFGGSGLGLAISQRLVDMLDGSISVDSTQGQGSTFEVALPVKIDASDPLIRPLISREDVGKEIEATKPKSLDCRVLVVDDRRDVRHISQHFLEKAGASVTVAEDGQQGFDVATAVRDANQPFDLILMDMQMPNVDGLQATAELRSAGIQWPIIALTADAMAGDRERCLAGGCDDYLSKPIDHSKLINMVAKYTQEISNADLAEIRLERVTKTREGLEESSS